jgi:two-component system, cell cycle sensor histidine kinase and response regulator CckA
MPGSIGTNGTRGVKKLARIRGKVSESGPGEQVAIPASLIAVLEPEPNHSVEEGDYESQDERAGFNGTSRTLTGRELRDSEVRYRRLFESAQDGILILDAETGEIRDVNPFLIQLLDYSREEFLGWAIWDLGLFSEIAASKAAFEELKDKGYIRYADLPLKTKDGRTVNVEFVSNVYIEATKKIIQCNIRDITASKHAGQREQLLLQSQRMEAVGQLAGGVAHDFNNLLQVILGYSEMLQEREDLSYSIRKMISKIQDAGISAKNLTQRLLAFSRRQVLQPVFLDLNDAVNRIQLLLDGLIGDDIKLESVLSPVLGTIESDPHQIEQVLMNLAINARDAMPDGGKIVFETANVEIDETYDQQQHFVKPGRYVMLTVTDTGTGMDAETQSHVFEPFFTTKEVGIGTGLGLSTVFGIVKQSGGAISIYSELGHGTAFKIHFPRRDEIPAAVQPTVANRLLGGTETILLVDDAPVLRELARTILEERGYTVIDSGDPADALRVAREHKGPLPLMITDVVMPGFSGIVLAERLSAERPETRVLYTSGYADDAVARHGVLGPDCGFIEKPFTRDDFVRKVRGLLDSPKSLLPIKQ